MKIIESFSASASDNGVFQDQSDGKQEQLETVAVQNESHITEIVPTELALKIKLEFCSRQLTQEEKLIYPQIIKAYEAQSALSTWSTRLLETMEILDLLKEIQYVKGNDNGNDGYLSVLCRLESEISYLSTEIKKVHTLMNAAPSVLYEARHQTRQAVEKHVDVSLQQHCVIEALINQVVSVNKRVRKLYAAENRQQNRDERKYYPKSKPTNRSKVCIHSALFKGIVKRTMDVKIRQAKAILLKEREKKLAGPRTIKK